MNQVKIVVPASSANVGLGYDVWCLGLQRPQLSVFFERKPKQRGIKFKADSPHRPPRNMKLGYSGKMALERFLKERLKVEEGGDLFYLDEPNYGYPAGGLGRSGAEAVGAVVAAAVAYEQKLSRNDVVIWSAKGEPGEHKDNVSASTNGRFNVIAAVPETGEVFLDYFDVPENLGIAIGYSSHKKAGGTEGLRKVLRYPVEAKDFVAQMGLVSAATAALARGETERFLELVFRDRFHEPRRADIGGYGRFTAEEFSQFKRELWEELKVALNVSGAGPNMQFLYSKNLYKGDITSSSNFVSRVVSWFEARRVRIEIRDMAIAPEGAYDFAKRRYGFGA